MQEEPEVTSLSRPGHYGKHRYVQSDVVHGRRKGRLRPGMWAVRLLGRTYRVQAGADTWHAGMTTLCKFACWLVELEPQVGTVRIEQELLAWELAGRGVPALEQRLQELKGPCSFMPFEQLISGKHGFACKGFIYSKRHAKHDSLPAMNVDYEAVLQRKALMDKLVPDRRCPVCGAEKLKSQAWRVEANRVVCRTCWNAEQRAREPWQGRS